VNCGAGFQPAGKSRLKACTTKTFGVSIVSEDALPDNSSTAHPSGPAVPERLKFEGRDWPVYTVVKMVAVIGLIGAMLFGYLADHTFRRFFFGYLAAYAFSLSIALGALFFVLIQHLTRAAWSVSVRRIAEVMAASMPILGVLSAPILLSVLLHNGDLYPWALPRSSASPAVVEAAAKGEEEVAEAAPAGHAEHVEQPENHLARKKGLDPIMLQKRSMLNPYFFTVCCVLCFAVLSVIALWYRRMSVDQDRSGDPAITLRMQNAAAPCTVVYALAVTLLAWLLIMSLDPHWYSTMFAVYYFSGAFLGFFAAIILAVYFLRRYGYLTESVTIEHFHDLGKYLFAFTFFYGYIAFSQYMLLWYANIPEEVTWFARHGATSVKHPQNGILYQDVAGWTWLLTAILFGQVLIPFAGLLSRHVKRVPGVLACWAAWVLFFHVLDCYWMVMPELGADFKFNVMDVFAFIGVFCVMLTGMFRFSATRPLRPTADPRLADSLAFQNI
jgi:hypothetical protein